MQNIISYKPVKASRFPKLLKRRTYLKLITYQLITLSILLNFFLAHKIYNVRCSVNGSVVGYFTTKEKCGELDQSEFDRIELERQLRVIANDQNYNQ